MVIGLFAFSTLVGLAMQLFPNVVSIPAIIVPLVMGSLLLGPRPLPWFVVYQLVLVTLALPKSPSFTARIGLHRRRRLPGGVDHHADVVPAVAAGHRGQHGGVDAGRAERPDPGAGGAARPARVRGTPSP